MEFKEIESGEYFGICGTTGEKGCKKTILYSVTLSKELIELIELVLYFKRADLFKTSFRDSSLKGVCLDFLTGCGLEISVIDRDGVRQTTHLLQAVIDTDSELREVYKKLKRVIKEYFNNSINTIYLNYSETENTDVQLRNSYSVDNPSDMHSYLEIPRTILKEQKGYELSFPASTALVDKILELDRKFTKFFNHFSSKVDNKDIGVRVYSFKRGYIYLEVQDKNLKTVHKEFFDDKRMDTPMMYGGPYEAFRELKRAASSLYAYPITTITFVYGRAIKPVIKKNPDGDTCELVIPYHLPVSKGVDVNKIHSIVGGFAKVLYNALGYTGNECELVLTFSNRLFIERGKEKLFIEGVDGTLFRNDEVCMEYKALVNKIRSIDKQITRVILRYTNSGKGYKNVCEDVKVFSKKTNSVRTRKVVKLCYTVDGTVKKGQQNNKFTLSTPELIYFNNTLGDLRNILGQLIKAGVPVLQLYDEFALTKNGDRYALKVVRDCDNYQLLKDVEHVNLISVDSNGQNRRSSLGLNGEELGFFCGIFFKTLVAISNSSVKFDELHFKLNQKQDGVLIKSSDNKSVFLY